ncbi:MAG TPA: hypothetical protein VLM44_09780 [Lutibacter sp.]|nr:hypothetical protein [Lutibacter sp.]
MKKNLLLVFVIATIAGCKNEVRYTQNSPEIETYKKAIKDYEMANWASFATHYADTAKIGYNTNEKNAMTLAQAISQNNEDIATLSSYNYIAEESEYEMVVTDQGETWVNFWGLWQGRLKANDQLYEIPVHLTAQFIDGKIVKEFGYWDNSSIAMELQKLKENIPPETITKETKE